MAWWPLPELLAMPPRRLHHLREEDHQWYGVASVWCARALVTGFVSLGILRDGGYAEYAILRSEAIAALPEDMDPAEAAPLLCAAVTCFSQ